MFPIVQGFIYNFHNLGNSLDVIRIMQSSLQKATDDLTYHLNDKMLLGDYEDNANMTLFDLFMQSDHKETLGELEH